MPGKAIRALAFVPSIVLVTLALALFPSAARDDAHITYWPAYAIARLGEIVNYNGERIEQSSSLLYVLVLAAIASLTKAALPTIGPCVSLLSGAFAVIGTQRLAAEFVGRGLALSAGLLVATCAYFAYWATGAMEATLAALVAVMLLHACTRYVDAAEPRLTYGPILVSMYLLVRPESLAVLAATLVGCLTLLWLGYRGRPDAESYLVAARRVAWICFVTCAAAAIVFGVRYLYFGSFFPQPVSAKTTGMGVGKVVLGAHFLMDWAVQPPLVGLLLVIGAGAMAGARAVLRGLQPRSSSLLLGSFLVAHLSFVVTTGGDYMEGARFVVPAIPVAAVLAAMALGTIVEKSAVVPLVVTMLSVQLYGALSFAESESTSMPLWKAIGRKEAFNAAGYSWFERANRIHIRDIPASAALTKIVRTLREAGTDPVWILSGQMGMVPFHVTREHFGHVKYIDRWSLATDDFTTCPITFGLPPREDFRWEVPYEFFLRNHRSIESECAIPMPDIIFEVTPADYPEGNGRLEQLLERHGFVVIHRQTGEIATGSRLHGARVDADEVIAVRTEAARHFERQDLRYSFP